MANDTSLPHEYAELTPDTVLDAVESVGYLADLRVLALNSYENRVYQVGIEGEEPLIAKFYRPGRWSDEQIIEEHQFSLTLADREIPVIPPIIGPDGATLFHYKNFRFSLYPRRGGHAPELENLDTLFTIGQHLGRIHAIGQISPFEHRQTLSTENFIEAPSRFILEHDFLPSYFVDTYKSLTDELLDKVNTSFAKIPYTSIRLHGDCHPGNIMARPDSLYFVDLDDAVTGPAVQDIWMLLTGDKAHQNLQISTIIEGYEEFHEFDYRELKLIDALRSLRLIHYAGWLAKRWEDPAFPMAFPWFNTEKYWSEHIVELREQAREFTLPD